MIKPIFLQLLWGLLMPAAVASNVTFRVSMSNETVSPSGVHIAGSFQSEIGLPADWNPSATEMTDGNGDNIFELTVNLPAGGYFFNELGTLTPL